KKRCRIRCRNQRQWCRATKWKTMRVVGTRVRGRPVRYVSIAHRGLPRDAFPLQQRQRVMDRHHRTGHRRNAFRGGRSVAHLAHAKYSEDRRTSAQPLSLHQPRNSMRLLRNYRRTALAGFDVMVEKKKLRVRRAFVQFGKFEAKDLSRGTQFANRIERKSVARLRRAE